MVIPKATENTITSFIHKELKKHGIKSMPFSSIETPEGRREVDLYCENGGTYFIEAKFTEKELFNAIAKIQNDYMRYHEILGINGCFSLLYPEELSKPMAPEKIEQIINKLEFKLICIFPPRDKRPFHVRKGSLEEIANVISDFILKPPVYIEPSIDFIIQALVASAKEIITTLKPLTSSQLESFFGGKNVFDNILQYEEKKIPIEELKQAVAYILLTQLLFYHVVSKLKPKFEEIFPEKIKLPTDLTKWFSRVEEVNYKAIFSYNVTPLIQPNSINKIKELINLIKAIAPEKIGGDLLGTIFHDLVPLDIRKSVAAFYTNILAAKLLAELAIDDSNEKVADFAVGSGGLLVAAYRRKKDLTKEFTEEIHKQFVENDLLGVDVMPFAAAIAASHLALQAPQYFTDKVKIAIWDSTELEPGKIIPTIAEVVKKHLVETIGQVTLKDIFPSSKIREKYRGVIKLTEKEPEEIKLDKFDVVIMNPPFTRQERLPKNYKEVLLKRFRNYRKYLHGQVGYFGYFIFLADKFIDYEKKIAFVLPATVLSKKHSEGIRRFLSDNYHIRYIVLNQERMSFSESTLFREILLVATKRKDLENKNTCIIILKKFPKTFKETAEIVETIRKTDKDYEDEKIIIKMIDYNILRKDPINWYKIIIYSPILSLVRKILVSTKLIPFFLMIKESPRVDLDKMAFKSFQNFILYDEDRAIRKGDVWIFKKKKGNSLIAYHKFLKDEIEIPLNSLNRGLRRHSNIRQMDVTENSDYIITSWSNGIKNMAKALLTTKELKKLDRLTIGKWKNLFEKRKSHIVVVRRPYLASPGTSFIAFYSDEPFIGINMWCLRNISKDDAKILTLWLNSSISLLQLIGLGIAAEGNWTKLDEYVLQQLLIPSINQLTGEEKKELLQVFENVKRKKFPSILEQIEKRYPERILIDKIWLGILGIKENEIDDTLMKIYSFLENELKLLKSIS